MTKFDFAKRLKDSRKAASLTQAQAAKLAGIKQLRREVDGSWVLESRNPDKRRFPDDRVDPGKIEYLKIHGEFVYRQGG